MMFGTHNPEKNTQTILSLSIIRTKCHVPREMQNSSIWSRLHYCLQKVNNSSSVKEMNFMLWKLVQLQLQMTQDEFIVDF